MVRKDPKIQVVAAFILCSLVHGAPTAPAADGTIAIHPLRRAQIAEINNNATVTWVAAAHPRFAALAPGASKPLCGVNGDWREAIDTAVAAGQIEQFKPSLNFIAPASFDSAAAWPECEKIISDIRDQSNCGCCWAFAGAEAASDRMCIATNASVMLPLSAQDICFGASGFMHGGCDGGSITTPWSYISGIKGVVTGGQYDGSGPFGSGLCQDFSLPHCHHHGPQGKDPYPAEGSTGCPKQSSPKHVSSCDSTAQAPHNDFKSDKYTFSGSTHAASGVEKVQEMIMSGGPVETAFTVYTDFEDYAGGIYQHTTGSAAGGHAVKIVGWGTEGGTSYWKVANSWNPFWGESGFFRIKQGDCGIDDRVIAAAANAKWSKKKS